MHPLCRLWRKTGRLAFLYLDDILLLAKSPRKLDSQLHWLLQTLEDAGLQINPRKCVLHPTQHLEHLGFHLDLQEGLLQVPSKKLQIMQKDLKELQHKECMTPRKVASILGTLRSFLLAFSPLRCFTDMMLAFVRQHQTQGWDRSLPLSPLLKEEIFHLLDLMKCWKGRKLEGQVPVRQLHSDSSDFMWAGLDLKTQRRVQEYWRQDGVLQITVKELKAAVETVKSLSHPKEVVSLGVDNQVAYWYLTKGCKGWKD